MVEQHTSITGSNGHAMVKLSIASDNIGTPNTDAFLFAPTSSKICNMQIVQAD